jgi:hypothetical protein
LGDFEIQIVDGKIFIWNPDGMIKLE